MYIDEIPVNSKISISFDYASKSTSLETKVQKPGSGSKNIRSVIANVARVNDKIVNINNFRGRVSVRYSVPGEKRSNVWKTVKIVYDRINKVYVIYTSKQSEKMERRSAQRITIGLGATVQIDGDARRRNCSIRDISVTGIGLRMDPLDYSAIGRRFVISFSDKSDMSSFEVRGRCVREVDSDGGKRTYGCTIKTPADLRSYIRRKTVWYENRVKAKGRG